MHRCRMGNPKRSSSFVCLRCLKIGISGIQRKTQREKLYRKELYCCQCRMVTKHIEIRHCDWIGDIMPVAEELHREYYNNTFEHIL